jgi:ectoine hydroxylase-related dioxygenase (phytanoyl-CoA dioxygenase family)
MQVRDESGRAMTVDVDVDAQPVFAPDFLGNAASEALVRAARARVAAEITRLGLAANVGDLETAGYTVLRPEQIATWDFVPAMRDKVLAYAEERAGCPVDVETGSSHTGLRSPFGQVQHDFSLLLSDRIFEWALTSEPVLALITYLLGESCVLNHMMSMVKGPGREHLPLHADQNQSCGPAPFPPYAQVANATWVLTEYRADAGAICFAPGSHKLCRNPTPSEAVDLSLFEPLEVPAGSVIVWHGNTWHGALPRRIPGVRVSVIAYYSRWYVRLADPISSRITDEMLQRNPPRFAVLTGVSEPLKASHGSEGARATKMGLFG